MLYDSQVKFSYLKDSHKENSKKLNRNYHLTYLQIKESEKNKDQIHAIQKQLREIKYKQSIVNRQLEETKEVNNRLISQNTEKMEQLHKCEMDVRMDK